MAFQKQQRGKSKFAGNRLTGLFKSRNKKGLYVGTARPDDVDGLIDKIKTAKKVGRGLTFFLWKNDIQSANTPVFSLSCDVAQERKVERAIEEDDEGDFVENESEPEDDDPFA